MKVKAAILYFIYFFLHFRTLFCLMLGFFWLRHWIDGILCFQCWYCSCSVLVLLLLGVVVTFSWFLVEIVFYYYNWCLILCSLQMVYTDEDFFSKEREYFRARLERLSWSINRLNQRNHHLSPLLPLQLTGVGNSYQEPILPVLST